MGQMKIKKATVLFSNLRCGENFNFAGIDYLKIMTIGINTKSLNAVRTSDGELTQGNRRRRRCRMS